MTKYIKYAIIYILMFCVYNKILPAGESYFLWEDIRLKQKESSLTSKVAAFGRAYHSKYDTPKIFDDYLAQDLISPQEFSDISKNMVQGIPFSTQTLQINIRMIRTPF